MEAKELCYSAFLLLIRQVISIYYVRLYCSPSSSLDITGISRGVGAPGYGATKSLATALLESSLLTLLSFSGITHTPADHYCDKTHGCCCCRRDGLFRWRPWSEWRRPVPTSVLLHPFVSASANICVRACVCVYAESQWPEFMPRDRAIRRRIMSCCFLEGVALSLSCFVRAVFSLVT